MMLVLQTLLMLSVSLLLCSGTRLTRQSSDNDDDDDSKEISLPNTDICGLSGAPYSYSTRIMGGRPAKLKEFPWMAALGYETRESKDITWQCGGSLITNQHVLTAAHCVDSYSLRKRILTKVRLGELDLDETVQDGAQRQDIGVGSMIVHEQYNMWEKTNDIAIIKMKTKVTFTDFVRPICLAPESFTKRSFVGHHPMVAGWGKNFVNGIETRDTRLMMVDVEIQSLNKCRKNMTTNLYKEETIDSRVICTFTKDQDSCEGDSGGPLMMPYRSDERFNHYLMGIVSYGPLCASQERFGVFTNVSSFFSWIVDRLDQNDSI